jgi:hypothetical protein
MESVMADQVREIIERDIAAQKDLPRRAVAGGELLQEGDYVARYYEKRYEPRVEGVLLVPGLRDADLSPTMAQEIDRLIEELKGDRVAPPAAPFPLERVQAALRELKAQLRWHALRSPQLATQFDQLAALHQRPRTPAALMLALSEHLLVARQHEALMRATPAFRPAALDEADELVGTWRAWSASAALPPQVRRVALVTLLRERIRLVVKAADYVYRDLPTVASEARSDALRARVERAARARRRKRKGDEGGETEATPASATPAAASATPTPVTPPADPA